MFSEAAACLPAGATVAPPCLKLRVLYGMFGMLGCMKLWRKERKKRKGGKNERGKVVNTEAAPLTRGTTISPWELTPTSFPGSHVSACYISVSPSPPGPLASHSTPDKKQGGSASISLFISRLPASQSLPCHPSFTVCLHVCVCVCLTVYDSF